MALAQKRIQENQGIKIGSPSNITTLAASSTTTIIINNGTQLGKPGTTFKTLTVNSPNSLLSGGVIKTMQPKTIITNAGMYSFVFSSKKLLPEKTKKYLKTINISIIGEFNTLFMYLSGSLLGTQLRPGIRLQLPGSTIQVRPQTVTLAPKIGTTITTTSGVNTITRLISPATVNTRVLSPATQPGTKSNLISCFYF